MAAGDFIRVLSTHCLLTTAADLTDRLTRQVREKRGGQPWSVDFTNVHIVAMRHVDGSFRDHTSSVDWFVPDSQILTWAASWLGAEGNERVYGPAFLDYFIREADIGLTHYFLGADQQCLDQLLLSLQERRPGLRVVGSHNGYFGAEDESIIVEEINTVKPDLVWVGLGTPKQQEWVHHNKEKLCAGALLAVGFAFDVNAGTKSDAPDWMGKMGVLWIYRFLSEPRRLFKRYAVYNSIFLKELFLQVMGIGSSRK